jgi:N-acetylglucosamine-6-phosphate deacetylase
LTCCKNAAHLCGLTLPQALRLASTNPVHILGLTGKGRIAAGFDADLLLLDHNFEPRLVIAGGQVLVSGIYFLFCRVVSGGI